MSSGGPDGANRPGRVLIVDDERQNRELLEVMLANEGVVLQTATSGEEALAMVATDPPDLILLDVMMQGMDGYHVAARLKREQTTRKIPVIMVTAMDDRDSRTFGLKAGAEDFLSKPIDRTELCLRVRNLLRLKAYSDYHDKYSHFLEGEVGLRTAELIESERLYRSTFDAAPVGIAHVGLDGRWLRVNSRLCDLLGYSAQELEHSFGLQPPRPEDDPEAPAARQRLASGDLETHTIDERYRRKDGSFFWARVNTSVHRGGDGRPQHFILVIEDVTESRSLEEKVRQAGKMDAIGRLAAGVAHDFNNLLTVILGFAEILAADASVAADHGKDLAEILKAAQRAAGLTKQLLAFSRQGALRPAPLDLNRLLVDMTEMLRRLIGTPIEVRLKLDPHLSSILADRSQIEQVVMNLVVNARDAMPGGGCVTIETRDAIVEDSTVDQEPVAPGSYVMLEIADTGLGMTDEVRMQAFEPFFTTKGSGQGTGLGLSTTYGIVKQSNGHISISSEPGRGTTFRLYFPRSAEPADVDTTLAEAVPVLAGKETLMLVDDEPGVRRLATKILTDAGYRVLEAENANEAESLFALRGNEIDLVLTDVMMPGCGGPELVRRLRVGAPALRVVFMSGHAEPVDLCQPPLDTTFAFLEKPFTVKALVRQVRAALDR